MGVWSRAPVGPGASPHADTDETFCESMLFCQGFKNESDIYIHC